MQEGYLLSFWLALMNLGVLRRMAGMYMLHQVEPSTWSCWADTIVRVVGAKWLNDVPHVRGRVRQQAVVERNHLKRPPLPLSLDSQDH